VRDLDPPGFVRFVWRLIKDGLSFLKALPRRGYFPLLLLGLALLFTLSYLYWWYTSLYQVV